MKNKCSWIYFNYVLSTFNFIIKNTNDIQILFSNGTLLTFLPFPWDVTSYNVDAIVAGARAYRGRPSNCFDILL